MSMISEQIKELEALIEAMKLDNKLGRMKCGDSFIENRVKIIKDAISTIQDLSAKLAAANMGRSSAYYNDEDDISDVMIRASRKAKTTTNDLQDTYNLKGLIGVYNLGLENMYKYLSKTYKK